MKILLSWSSGKDRADRTIGGASRTIVGADLQVGPRTR